LTGCLAVLHPGARAAGLAGIGVSLVEWSAAWILVWAALREAVPAMSLGPSRNATILAVGLGVHAAVGVGLWWVGGGAISGPWAGREVALCSGVLGALAVPQLALAAWLVMRALPLRPRWSGALAGAAAGLFADSIWHLVCGRVDLLHLAIAHAGTVVVATVAGWGWGRAVSLRESPRRRG
jgi:hypothetical protein